LARVVPLLREFCAGKGRFTPQVLAEFEEGMERGMSPVDRLDEFLQ
jgi:hypothetical protein